MYAKLAFRNVKRSMGDYAVYVFTLILSITLIFAYNSLLFSDAIKSFSELMKPMMGILLCVTGAVVLILGWLISYITRFIFEQRSREFACYLTMGMEQKSVSRLFLLEQVLIGTGTLVVGIILGNLFYLALSQVIFNLFGREYVMDLSFQLPAIGLTIGCFLLIFAFSLYQQNRIFRKIHVKELMDFERVNEVPSYDNKSKSIRGIFTALLLGVLGLAALAMSFGIRMPGGFTNMLLMVAGILLQGLSLLGFYRYLSQRILERYRKNEKKRLHHLNMFFYRQLTGKLKTNGKRMGVISILLLITLLGLSGGTFLASAYEETLAKKTSFDIGVAQYFGAVDGEKNRAFIEERTEVTGDHSYWIYRIDGSEIIVDTLDKKKNYEGFEEENRDACIRLSDYNRLRQLLKLEPIELEEDEYAVQCEEEYFAGEFKKSNPDLEFGGHSYQLKKVYTDYFAQDAFNEGAYTTSTLLVLPDQACEGLAKGTNNYVAMVQDREKTGFSRELEAYNNEITESWDKSFSVVITYEDQKREYQSVYMMSAFICYYAGFICIFICATILAVQQLNNSKKYRHQYDLLRKMGATADDIRRLVLKQVAAYFMVPLIMPMVFTIIYGAGISAAFPAQGKGILVSFSGAVGIFVLVYGCYFLLTWLQYQKNILKGTQRYNVQDLL